MNWNEFLWEACDADDLELAAHALRQGADPNAALGATVGIGEDLHTPLFWAVFGGRIGIVRLLLAWGARVAAERGHESTSLHQSVEDNNTPIVEMLLAADGRIALDWFDYVSRTPLIIAAEQDNLTLAQMLIDAGADVNARHEEQAGDTALHQVAAKGTLPMARLLIGAGADPHLPAGMGITPLDQVRRRKRGDGLAILALLEQAGRGN